MTLKNDNRVGLLLVDFEIYYKTTLINIMCYRHRLTGKKMSVEQIESMAHIIKMYELNPLSELKTFALYKISLRK